VPLFDLYLLLFSCEEKLKEFVPFNELLFS